MKNRNYVSWLIIFLIFRAHNLSLPWCPRKQRPIPLSPNSWQEKGKEWVIKNKDLVKFDGSTQKKVNLKQGACKSNLLTRCHSHCANNHNHIPAIELKGYCTFSKLSLCHHFVRMVKQTEVFNKVVNLKKWYRRHNWPLVYELSLGPTNPKKMLIFFL